MTMVLFSAGQMYSALIIWAMSPDMKHDELHWRVLLALAALLPTLLAVLAYFFLLESPHWLLAQRRFSEAKHTVWQMAEYKGTVTVEVIEELTSGICSPDHSPESRPRLPPTPEQRLKDPFGVEEERSQREGSFSSDSVTEKWEREREEFWRILSGIPAALKEDFGRFSLLFSDKFKVTTILMSYISFVSNFAYYGMIYGLPDTLKKEQPANKEGMYSPAAGVFFSAVFEIPGVFIAILLGTTVGRKMNMTISFGCTALSLAAVICVLKEGDMDGFGLVAVFCVKLFIASVFIVVYLYLLECYPTKFRATGLAFCMVVGRLGAFACPFLYDGLEMLKFHHMWFFITMGGLVTLAAIVSLLLPYETKDSQLMEDDAPVDEPLLSPRAAPVPYNTLPQARNVKE